MAEERRYEEAFTAFEQLGGFRDSADQAYNALFNQAMKLNETEGFLGYEKANAILEELGGYRASADSVYDEWYNRAGDLLNGKNSLRQLPSLRHLEITKAARSAHRMCKML